MKQEDSPLSGHPDTLPLRILRAKGIRASDGDTISAWVESEPWRYEVLDLRLSTIDTYELHTGPVEWRVLGAKARDFSNARVEGQWLRVISVLDTEKYGRTLTAIEFSEQGTWFDLAFALRAAGYEKPRISAARRSEIQRNGMLLHRARTITLT